MASKVPEFCSYQCPHSAFPPADAAGLCRTMAAVYCKKLKGLVDKNAPCRWRANRPKRVRRKRP